MSGQQKEEEGQQRPAGARAGTAAENKEERSGERVEEDAAGAERGKLEAEKFHEGREPIELGGSVDGIEITVGNFAGQDALGAMQPDAVVVHEEADKGEGEKVEAGEKEESGGPPRGGDLAGPTPHVL